MDDVKDHLLKKVRQASEALGRDRRAVADAEGVLRTRIREAIGQGCTVAEVAEISGLSRERIYQIRDGRR